jgi:hypothetical protein
MSTYVNLPGGPEAAVRVGLKLKGLAGDLAAQAEPVVQHINEIEHQAPWGDDDPGNDLRKRYTQETPSGPFNESLRKQLDDAGKPLGELADFILQTIANIENTDLDGSRDIQSL